ncbi:MAG: N-acyl homoserine lactonase family protein [Desulfobacteraceae bacterium]|nr:MAG: N-acyl homoserine lactonase family protein [Desulfobacteraceae bacterium]
MSKIKIYPLHIGTISRHKDSFTFKLGYGEKIDVPILVWYLEAAGKKILIDTGGCDPEDPQLKPWVSPYTRPAEQELPHVLQKKFGLKPDDIDIVLISHMHWDHVCGNDLFPNAQFIVQEKELESARNPIPILSPIYVKRFIDNFPYTTVNGDKEIVEGVSVVFTPGHSEGFQGVLIEAENNRYFLAGDNIALYDSLKHTPPWPSGLYINFRDYYDSLHKIQKLEATILPGHDMLVLEKEYYN